MGTRLPSYPAVVDEHAARIAAGLVTVGALAAYAFDQPWAVGLLAAGFATRALAGPRYSPLARVAGALARRLGPPRLVAGAPKRFAQGVGLAFSGGALVLFAAGAPAMGWGLVLVLTACAALEAGRGLCLGCWVYGTLQRAGWLAPTACPTCAVGDDAGGSCAIG